MKKIGIIGGMGPESTISLMQKIFEITDAKNDQEHVPLLVDNNTQVPSRIDFIINENGLNPLPVLLKMAKALEKSGAEALAMPCNTAHIFEEEIRASISIPFISIVEEAISFLNTMKISETRIGIFASPAVKITRLFEAALNRNNMTAVYVGENKLLLSLINKIKAKEELPTDLLEKLTVQISKEEIDFTLISCSEFSVISNIVSQYFKNPVVDTLDILATKIVNFSR